MDPLDDPKELGRRIAAARGYASLDLAELSARLGVSTDQMRRWEAGLGQGERIGDRKLLAERIAEVTAAPRLLLGLAENPSELVGRIEVLEAEMARVQRELGSPGRNGGSLGLIPEGTEARVAPPSPRNTRSRTT